MQYTPLGSESVSVGSNYQGHQHYGSAAVAHRGNGSSPGFVTAVAVPQGAHQQQQLLSSIPHQDATRIPLFVTGSPHWSSSLVCDCTKDCGSCWDSLCCTPCAMGYQYGILRSGQRGCDGTGCLLASCCPQLAAWDIRVLVRHRYGIEGNCCFDGCAACLCTPCTVSQNYRECSLRGAWPGGVLACSPYVRYQGVVLNTPSLGPMNPGESIRSGNQQPAAAAANVSAAVTPSPQPAQCTASAVPSTYPSAVSCGGSTVGTASTPLLPKEQPEPIV